MFICIFFISFVLLLSVRCICCRFDMVDKPNYRKKHADNIPIAGGIAIYLTVVLFHLLLLPNVAHADAYLISGTFLVCVGALDDYFDLPVLPRAAIQALAAILLMCDGLYFISLGELWFGEALILGSFGYLLTLVAISATINAFNMIDGIDGLLAGLTMVTFLSLTLCFFRAEQIQNAMYCLSLIVILLPFMMLNIGFPFGKDLKVFMGDSGSTLLGFTVIWQIMLVCQGKNPTIAPATCLWFIAIPLMDAVVVMFGRIKHKKSPFRPDRTHLHHYLIDYGFSAKTSLILIITGAMLIAAIGLGLDALNVSDMYVFLLFLVLFVFYSWLRNQFTIKSNKMPIR